MFFEVGFCEFHFSPFNRSIFEDVPHFGHLKVLGFPQFEQLVLFSNK